MRKTVIIWLPVLETYNKTDHFIKKRGFFLGFEYYWHQPPVLDTGKFAGGDHQKNRIRCGENHPAIELKKLISILWWLTEINNRNTDRITKILISRLKHALSLLLIIFLAIQFGSSLWSETNFRYSEKVYQQIPILILSNEDEIRLSVYLL